MPGSQCEYELLTKFLEQTSGLNLPYCMTKGQSKTVKDDQIRTDKHAADGYYNAYNDGEYQEIRMPVYHLQYSR